MPEITQHQKEISSQVLNAMAAGERDIILTGGSGTGKSTTAAHIIHTLGEVNQLMGTEFKIIPTATTNQAAQVLGKALGSGASTVYSHLGLYPERGKIRSKHSYKFFNENQYYEMLDHRLNSSIPLPKRYLLVDEYSYTSKELLFWMMYSCPADTGFIHVGDKDQLLSPSIKDTVSPVTELNPVTFELTEQHRSFPLPDGTNPIRDLAWKFRDAIHTGEIYDIDLAENIILIEDETEFYQEISKAYNPRTIAYTNERVAELAQLTNKAGTVHKAQGDSADTVFMDLRNMALCMDYDSISTFNRLMYVGISRARKKLVIYYE